jgi:hypothetical protein
MTTEDVARRYSRLPGYELIDYARIALPLYRLTVDAVTIVHRDIPPIKEFVMRSIELGINHLPELSAFLGLDEETVRGTLSQLRDDRYASVPEDLRSVQLLDRGRDILIKAKVSAPQDETIVFLYDRLARRPVRLTPDQLIAPRNIDPRAMIEIRPYPVEGPELSDLILPEVLEVLEKQAGGRARFGRDLLRLKRILRRVRVYRPAVGLVFKKTRGNDFQIGFVVDDARNEALEHAFAERGGPKKMGFVKSISESVAAAELRRQLGPRIQQILPDPAALDEKRLKVSLLRIKHQSAVTRAERKESSLKRSSDPDVEAALRNLSEAQDELRAFAARSLLPFEITELLDQAITESKLLLAVSSRDAEGHIVNPIFLRNLEDTLKRGATVVISLTEPDANSNAVLTLERLRQTNANLNLVTGRRTNYYYLICDSRYALIYNRPLLGNQGKVRTFQQVVGYVLQTPELVSAFLQRMDPLSAPRQEGLRAGQRQRAGR